MRLWESWAVDAKTHDREVTMNKNILFTRIRVKVLEIKCIPRGALKGTPDFKHA